MSTLVEKGRAGADWLRSGEALRRPFWLETDAGPMATWLHHPRDGQVLRSAVVICPPIGFEYTHAHRTLRHLADHLASRGLAALRVDYPGTGSSAGDESSTAAVDGWLEGIDRAVDFAERLTGGAPASLVGLRLGAALAGVAASKREIRSLVAWAPITSGRRFARETRALHLVGGRTASDTDFLEAGGFRFSQETLAGIAELNLGGVDLPLLGGALIVDRLDQPVDSHLKERFAALDRPATVLMQSDYPDMMAEPQYTVVPQTLLTDIVAWVADGAGPAVTPLPAQVLAEVEQSRVADMTSGTGLRHRDTQLLIPIDQDRDLFGILSVPAKSKPPGAPLVLLPNSGAVHQAGPNRLYVELASELVGVGVPTFRFDLRNLGDSCTGNPPDENHPYPETASDDMRVVLAFLRSELGYETFSATGLCSGGHTAFHASLELKDDPIGTLISINPLTFRYQRGMSLDTPLSYRTTADAKYYQAAIWDRARWKKLLTGRADVRYIASFVAKRVGQRSSDVGRSLARRLGLGSPGVLERDLHELHRLGRSIRFIFSSSDPGHEVLAREAGPTCARLQTTGAMHTTIVADADHTFSRKKQRVEAIAAVTRYVRPRAALRREVMSAGADMWPRVEPAWRELLEATSESSAFLSADWVRSWVEPAAREGRTFGVVWFAPDDTVVGSAILTWGKGVLGPFRTRRIFLNSTGVEPTRPEHNDVLTLPEYRDDVLADLMGLIRESAAEDIGLLGVRPELVDAIRSLNPDMSWDGYESESPFVALNALRASGKDYMSMLSASTRSQVRRSTRLYESRLGESEITIAKSADEAMASFREMLRLHDKTWLKRGRASGFTPEARRHHADLIAGAWRTQGDAGLRTDVVRIRFGTEVVGVLYHLNYRGYVQFYQGGLRYEADHRLKPGLVSHSLAIQHYLDAGAIEYDFLGGEPKPVRYKRSLSSDRRPLYWGELSLPGTRMTILNTLRDARRKLSR
jgi:alpha/beta superfamily hydrolase